MNYAGILLSSTVGLILGYWYFSAQYWFDIDRVGKDGEGGANINMPYCLSEKTSDLRIGEPVEGSRSNIRAGERTEAGVGGPDQVAVQAILDQDSGLDDCDEKDLDEIENWLAHLERDLAATKG